MTGRSYRIAIPAVVGLLTAAAFAAPADAASRLSSGCRTFQCGVAAGYQAGYWDGQLRARIHPRVWPRVPDRLQRQQPRPLIRRCSQFSPHCEQRSELPWCGQVPQ